MRTVRQVYDARQLGLVDERRAGVQIGDDGDVQSLERAGVLDCQSMFDQRQTGWLDPCCVQRQRNEQSGDEGGDGTAARGKRTPQKLIRARDSSETELAPFWPAKFIW
jgi:hypothetical protein